MIGIALPDQGGTSQDAECAACGTEAKKTPEGTVKRYPTIGSHPDIWLCRICATTSIGNIGIRSIIGQSMPENADVLRTIAQVGNQILKELKAISQGTPA